MIVDGREDEGTLRALLREVSPGTVVVLSGLEWSTAAVAGSQGRDGSRDPVQILSIDDGLDYLLDCEGRRFTSLRDLLPPDAYIGIHRLAEEFAARWNLIGDEDVTEFDGTSYASLVQWEMTLFLARVMKSVVDAQVVRSAGCGNTFLIPVRAGADAMIPFSRRDIMGDRPELLLAEALALIGEGEVGVRRVVLAPRSAPYVGLRRWRIRLSAALQRCIVQTVLPLVRRRRVYVQDEYYLGPDVIPALTAGSRYQVVRETSGGMSQCLRGLRGRGPLHVPPAWFARRAASDARRRASQHFHLAWGRLRAIGPTGALRFRGADLEPLIARKLEFLFRRRFPELAGEQVQVRAWLKTTGIRASVLVEQVMQWSRQMIAAGRPVGMVSLCVQHGVMGYRDLGVRHGFVPAAADVMAVWGDISHEWMRRAGVPAERLAIVGAPRFDRYPQAGRPPVSEEDHQAFCQQVGMRSDERLILYAESATQPYLFPDIHPSFRHIRANLEMLLAAVRRLPGFRLGIRLKHGAGDAYIELYRDLCRRAAVGNVTFLPPLPLGDLLLHCELAVVSLSGVAIEALYYDHPVVVVDSTGYHGILPIVQYGAGIVARSADEIVDFVRGYDRDPDLRAELRRGRVRLLNDSVAGRDGGASRRAVELLDMLVDRGVAATRAAITARNLACGVSAPAPVAGRS